MEKRKENDSYNVYDTYVCVCVCACAWTHVSIFQGIEKIFPNFINSAECPEYQFI